MSNKIHIPYYIVSNTVYVVIRDDDGKVWNTSAKAFEAWNDSNIANYVINATSKGGSLYIAEFPLDAVSAYYTMFVFLQSGASPSVSSDIWIGTLSSYWDKTNQNLEIMKIAGITTIERAPKIQIESTEVISGTDLGEDIEVIDPEIQRGSSASIGTLERDSYSQVTQ